MKTYSRPGIEHLSPAEQASFTEESFAVHIDFIRVLLNRAVFRERRLSTCLDIGCNSGSVTAIVSGYFPEVVGIDTSKPLVRIAAERFRQHDFMIVDGCRLPFPEASFDCVTGFHSFGYFHNEGWKKALVESLRVVRPGGIVVLEFPQMLHRVELVARAIYYFLTGARTFRSSMQFLGDYFFRGERPLHIFSSGNSRRRKHQGIDVGEILRIASAHGGKFLEFHRPKRSFCRPRWVCAVLLERGVTQ